MPNTFSLSTAIAYVNGAPHIGHALEFVEADCLARYHRMIGDEVYYLTGTDEHGSKIVATAEKQGMGVQEMVDMNAQKFKDMMELYSIQYDQFIRTSDQERHWPSVHKLWRKMAEKGDIYKGEYKGLYCVGCEEYKQEKDLVDGKCPNHDTEPEVVEQENYFFKLSKYSDQIAELLRSKKLKIVPDYRANEIISLCEQGLEDVSFSRPKEQLSWGVPVPDDESQTMYVWCDALTNYISALDYANEGELFEKFWPMDCHVIGKDILRFHAGIWIGMLLSAEVELPKSELVHGWIHFDGGRMSKSKGNVVDPIALANEFGVDATRYYLLSEIPVGADGNFTYELFVNKINADLANNLGNFLNRVVTMTDRFLEGAVPSSDSKLDLIDKIWKDYHQHFENYDHQRASQSLIELVNEGNKMIADNKPWEMAKDESRTDELKKLMAQLLDICLQVAFLLEPFCPEKAKEIMACFGLEDQLNANGYSKLQAGELLSTIEKVTPQGILFERKELPGEEE